MILAVIIAVLTPLFYMIVSKPTTAQHKQPVERQSEGCALGVATSSSTPSSQVTEITASSSVPTSDCGATVSQDVSGSGLVGEPNRAQEIREKAAQLQHTFMTIVMHTKRWLMKKEAELLIEFKSMLEELPLSVRYQHLHFLKEKKSCINMANNVKEIWDILRCYWSYRDYSFLKWITKEFGTSELMKEMKDYILELEEFEKTTSVKDYNSAAQDEIEIPAHFKELAITQLKDPAQCSLYDVCMLIKEIVDRSALTEYSVRVKSLSPSSVKIVLAFPAEAYKYISAVLDEKFMKIHQLEVRP